MGQTSIQETQQKRISTPTESTLNKFFERAVKKAIKNAGGENSFAGMVIKRTVEKGRKWSVNHE